MARRLGFADHWTDPSQITVGYRRAYASPTTFFELFVDGARVPSVFDISYDRTTDYWTKLNVSNFPGGLPAGTYTFEPRWYLDASQLGGTFGHSGLVAACDVTVIFTS